MFPGRVDYKSAFNRRSVINNGRRDSTETYHTSNMKNMQRLKKDTAFENLYRFLFLLYRVIEY